MGKLQSLSAYFGQLGITILGLSISPAPLFWIKDSPLNSGPSVFCCHSCYTVTVTRSVW